MNWYNSLNLGKKIIFPLVLASFITGFCTYLYFSNLYKETETKALVTKARAIVLSAESSREFTAQQIRNNVFKTERLTKEAVLYTVPIFAAMQTAKEKATELGFSLKVPKFNARNPENEPDVYESKILKAFERGESNEFWEIDNATNKVRFFRPVKLTEECLNCHGDPANSMQLWGNTEGRDITGGKMENWKVGEVHGAFEVMMPMDPVDSAVANESLMIAGISGLGMGLIILIGLYAVRRIVSPIKRLEEAANRVASGSIDVSLEIEMDDEIGRLTKSFNIMVNNIRSARTELLNEKAGIQQKVDDAVGTIAAEKLYLTRSVDTMLVSMNKFKDGDLTVRLIPEKDDEIGRLFTGFNRAIENFKTMLNRLAEAVSATSSASTQISSSTEEMAAGASEQTQRTDDIASAVDEMVKTIISNTRGVSDASAIAKNAGEKAKEGGKVVALTIEGMNKVSEVVNHSADTIEELGKSSDEIGAIIQVIEEIADQTNLLALNAAIEAARAGEQGRGFAVVADEVKKLAERTTKATKEIAVMIKQIQANTTGAVKSIKDGTKQVEAGRDLAVKAGSVLNEIINEADKVVDIINQVAAASEEQSSAAENISQNIESITNISHENAIGTQQIAQAAEDLNQLTEKLQVLINQFKVTEDVNHKSMGQVKDHKVRLKLN
jgi:methyl-accepting chemotaxis protein